MAKLNGDSYSKEDSLDIFTIHKIGCLSDPSLLSSQCIVRTFVLSPAVAVRRAGPAITREQPLIAGFRCQSEGRRQGYKAERQGSEQTIVLKGVSGLNVQNQSAGEFLPRFQELLIVRQDNHEKEFRKSPALCAAGPSSFAGCDRISSSLEPCSLVVFDAIGGADRSSLGHCYLPMLGILEACLLE